MWLKNAFLLELNTNKGFILTIPRITKKLWQDKHPFPYSSNNILLFAHVRSRVDCLTCSEPYYSHE